MLENRIRCTLTLVGLLTGSACASPAPEKTTGTHWLECNDDPDCAVVPGARCRDDGVCIDASGHPIRAERDAGANGGGGGGAGASGGAVADAGGSGGGADADGGGMPPFETVVIDCYSPGQNLDSAYEPGAVGCKCPEGSPSLCRDGVALVCTDGRWQAVEDGDCSTCWTPESSPETLWDRPEEGCECSLESETHCAFTLRDGYARVSCIEGTWVLERQEASCGCETDSSCGIGGRCVDGACMNRGAACEVDGVRYAEGVGGIPHPIDCTTCTCGPGADLDCTSLPCPAPPECPSGTTAADVCIACGLAGGCSIRRTGCLPYCETEADCAGTYLSVCDASQNACTIGLCF